MTSLVERVSVSAVVALMTVFTPAVIATQVAHAQTFTTLYSFKGPLSDDGGIMVGGVVLDDQGNVYGNAGLGGTYDDGIIFQLDASGNETKLHDFQGTDGNSPVGRLVRDAAGNLYGVTSAGGNPGCYPYGCGTVFKLDSRGVLTVLYRFQPNHDAKYPYAGLIRDGAGNLYGTTPKGGTFNDGAVFKVDASSKERVLYNFTGGADGAVPFGDLIRDTAGNLFGTASRGGVADAGTVFRLDTAGNLEVLYSFAGGADGSQPFSGLVRDAAGNFYGTTSSYADPAHRGTVFKLDVNNQKTILHNFDNGGGRIPVGGLALDAAGNLYGTAGQGGDSDKGTVFLVSATGKFKLLHSFSGSDGENPQARLTLDGKGSIYGTTYGGGAFNYWGTVFKITR
ncbi:MAG TPA: choice-of-anchor tandem repeat GloVer-containing protein [Terriglobales bacterium]|jgi:uncharacterized repeat protein (TIGR03803 family)